VHVHLHIFVFRKLAFLDQAGHEIDCPELPEQGGVERDLVQPIDDFARCPGHFAPFQRIDLDENNVGRLGVIKERVKRRIAHIAAVPIRFAVNFHRLVELRQTGRCHNRVKRDFLLAEDADLAGKDIRRSNKQPYSRAAVNLVEIDHFLHDIPQRIDVEWIELVRRGKARKHIEIEIAR